MKDYLRKVHNRISDDRGSTLITVIVAIAFVTILVTIILGTTVVNVRMKGIDRRTKDDFYYAERSLNDIYTGLGQELARVAGDEYETAFKKVGNIEGLDDYNMAETAEKDFRKKFMNEVYDKVKDLTSTDLEEYILGSSKGHVIWDKTNPADAVVYQKKDGSTTTLPEEASRVVLKNVKVYVEDTSGFRSTISTDIVITIPTVDFLGTNADVSDYGLIANEGLYIEGDVNITGNVYAGVHEDYRESLDKSFKERTDEYSKTPVYGGINIKGGKATFDGNYIISKGDVNLSGSNPQIKINPPAAGADVNLANLWFTSMRTIKNEPGNIGANIDPHNPATDPSKATIDVNANIFALNDMALNADNSSVVIKGNYYGYNEGGLNNILGKKDGRDDTANSAIIVNGSKAYLDMRDINNFVLMGKAYIDFTSDTDTDAASMESHSLEQVVPTAESVALKTNQQLYLVPTDFLDGPNPVEDTAESHAFNINVLRSDLENWFGYGYLNTSVDTDPTKAPASMHKSYKVKLSAGAGGSNVFYDYLVFDDTTTWKPESASSLMADTANTKYIVQKDSTGSFKFLKYTKSTDPLGTGGSISSKAMFFLKIMMSRNAYEYAHSINDEGISDLDDYIEYKESDSSIIQPSEYRLYDRINRSMDYDYFDLSQCVVGNSSSPDDAHYYARNAVINYEKDAADKIQSNVLNNTDGMLRYATYTQNLYHRYIFLCTRLDGKEDKLLDADPGTPDMGEWKVKYESSEQPSPICHFVKLDNIETMSVGSSIVDANAEGLKTGAYGVCIATDGDLDISTSSEVGSSLISSKTFKGVAIVDGNITVDSNIDIDGLLMATGTITLKGNNNINYNKGLIQSRIEKEMNIVKNKDAGVSDPYKNYYVINYLSKDDEHGNPQLLYQVDAGSKIKRDRIEADYNDFMHYENWQKGEE